MYKNFISITPALNENELLIFSLFNDICELTMDKKSKINSVWLHDIKGTFSDGFEIINPKCKKENLEELLEEKINLLDNFSSSNFFRENISLIANYKDLFLKSYLENIHHNNYKLYGNANNLNHLIKVVHLFHGQGFLNKFLSFDIAHHHFNNVIANEYNDEAYIIDNTSIYKAYLEPSGYYSKQGELTSSYLENLLYMIESKTMKDNLESLLQSKDKSIIKKI